MGLPHDPAVAQVLRQRPRPLPVLAGLGGEGAHHPRGRRPEVHNVSVRQPEAEGVDELHAGPSGCEDGGRDGPADPPPRVLLCRQPAAHRRRRARQPCEVHPALLDHDRPLLQDRARGVEDGVDAAGAAGDEGQGERVARHPVAAVARAASQVLQLLGRDAGDSSAPCADRRAASSRHSCRRCRQPAAAPQPAQPDHAVPGLPDACPAHGVPEWLPCCRLAAEVLGAVHDGDVPVAEAPRRDRGRPPARRHEHRLGGQRPAATRRARACQSGRKTRSPTAPVRRRAAKTT